MKMIIRLMLLFLPTLLVSCAYLPSFTQGRDQQYLEAKSIPPLRVPPGIATSAFHNSFPVSDRQYPEAAKDVSIVPPGL